MIRSKEPIIITGDKIVINSPKKVVYVKTRDKNMYRQWRRYTKYHIADILGGHSSTNVRLGFKKGYSIYPKSHNIEVLVTLNRLIYYLNRIEPVSEYDYMAYFGAEYLLPQNVMINNFYLIPSSLNYLVDNHPAVLSLFASDVGVSAVKFHPSNPDYPDFLDKIAYINSLDKKADIELISDLFEKKLNKKNSMEQEYGGKFKL